MVPFAPCAVLCLVGDVEAVYTFGRKDRRRRDLGNLEKVTSDQLVKWGVMQDDSQIVRLTLEWGDVLPGYVRVQLMEKGP